MPIYKSKLKKDGKQGYRVCINYTDKYGRAHRIERTAYGSPEAKQLERELLEEYSARDAVSSRMTVQELYNEYMTAKKHEVRASSYDKTRRILEGNILPILGDVRLDRLNAPTLQQWKNQISERGIAVSTQKAIYTELRTMLNYAVRMEHLARNPLVTVGNFKDNDFTPPQDKLQYYTAEQFQKFIAAARAAAAKTEELTDWGYFVFFAVAYYTGMRKGEIHALKWSDIDGDTLYVRRSISQKLKGNDVETLPKNKTSYRSLQIPEPLKAVLAEHKERQKRAFSDFTDDYRVCVGQGCLRDSSINNKNEQFAKTAELPRIRIHDFRHSHASLLANDKHSRNCPPSRSCKNRNDMEHIFAFVPSRRRARIEYIEPSKYQIKSLLKIHVKSTFFQKTLFFTKKQKEIKNPKNVVFTRLRALFENCPKT